MDVSSRYFTLLRRPDANWLKHVYCFLTDIQRVGKLSELISFVLWEVKHRLKIYAIGRQYVKFVDAPFITLRADRPPEASLGSLSVKGLSLQPILIDWKYCSQTTDGVLWGCRFSHLNALYCSYDESQSAVRVHAFEYPISSLFINQRNDIFVCSNGRIFKSTDQGKSFRVVLHLSTPISYFLFNNGMTELPDHTLLLGEYGSLWLGESWQNLAYLYSSVDDGETWQTSDFLIQQGVNKHLHLVRYCARLNAVLLTDGDNKKQVWLNTSLSHFNQPANKAKAGWQLINKCHYQMGGYLSVAESTETVLLGSDYLGGTNFIVSTPDGRRFNKAVLPDPYRRSPIMNMVSRLTASGCEIWAVSYSCLSRKAKSLLMRTTDSGKTWERIIEFDGANHEIRLINATHNQVPALYVSITTFGPGQEQPQHQIYQLTDRNEYAEPARRRTGEATSFKNAVSSLPYVR